ncbi:MAG: CPBP family intramembrane glutamic endopeptidase [Candidatus Acidiferrales bacterium]
MAANKFTQPSGESNQLIASPWHTLFVIVAAALYAYRSATNAANVRAGLVISRPRMYLRTMLFELLFLAIVIFGVRLRGVSLDSIFGRRWHSFGAALRDLGLGIALILVATIVVSTVGALLHDTSNQSIQFLLPQSSLEMALWIVLSTIAGICEEAVYRGYFQRQFAAITRSLPAGILLSGAAFGAAHLYQGWRRAVPIAVMGALFGIVAQWRGTVRPGMFGHVIQDSVAPLLVKLIHH